jgi:predicted nucleic acid-binding protein
VQWILDSTVLIDYLRGRNAVARVGQLLDLGDTVATTAINVEEIVRGLREPELDAARALFAGLEVLPVTGSDAWLAGAWRREQAARGVTLAQADCLIAAVTRNSRARLATGNPKDFAAIEDLVDHWPAGV